MFFSSTLDILLYILTILYFCVVGCFMVMWRGKSLCTHGEEQIKLRMMRSVGIFMFIWMFDYLLYLPPMLESSNIYDKLYNVCFLITLMLATPAIFVVMQAVAQKHVNTLRWVVAIGLPFLLLLLWYVFMPMSITGDMPVHLASIFSVLFVLFLLLWHSRQYRVYVQRIKSEYSDISGRDILWSWSCFVGFAAQMIFFIIYEYTWVPLMQYFYWALSIVNATYLCHCTCNQRPLDSDVVEEEPISESLRTVASPKRTADEKAFYAVIEHKLDTLCEQKFLYLEPDLTRETLCHRLSISGTYLKMYFHSRHTSFYQYINTLRVEYAHKLMLDNPHLSIREISERSGFRSQTTFRKVFTEVIGQLPSGVRRKRGNDNENEN